MNINLEYMNIEMVKNDLERENIQLKTVAYLESVGKINYYRRGH